jgi:hypothetical protein
LYNAIWPPALRHRSGHRARAKPCGDRARDQSCGPGLTGPERLPTTELCYTVVVLQGVTRATQAARQEDQESQDSQLGVASV